MKQVYLRARGRLPRELRSDTLFGLIAWGVREVYGRESVERFLAPLSRDPPASPLLVTSAFPYVERHGERTHYFPRPLGTADPTGSGLMEDRELLAFVSGHEPPQAAVEAAGAWSGLFFLAAGPGEPYLEAAVAYLARAGFGGAAAAAAGGFDVEVDEAEFLRLAQPAETGLLLSLHHPTLAERQAIAERAALGAARYGIERRAGVVGGRLARSERPHKRPLVALREGSVVPVVKDPPGCAPVVAEADDGAGSFPVLYHGFGFLVPVGGAAP